MIHSGARGVPDRSGFSVPTHLFRHVGEASGGDEVSADGMRVSRRGIEATRDQDDVRTELPCHRHNHAPVERIAFRNEPNDDSYDHARSRARRSKIRAPFLPERGQVLGVSHGRLEPARPRNVDVETDAGTDPALDRTSGSRVKVAVVVAVQ